MHGVQLFDLPHEGVQCGHSLLGEVKTYPAWCKMDKAEWCCILTSMSRIMHHQLESMHTIYDIMVNLKVMFGDPNHDDRQEGINVFLNTKMTKDPRSSYRCGNPGRYSAHNIAKVLQGFLP